MNATPKFGTNFACCFFAFRFVSRSHFLSDRFSFLFFYGKLLILVCFVAFTATIVLISLTKEYSFKNAHLWSFLWHKKSSTMMKFVVCRRMSTLEFKFKQKLQKKSQKIFVFVTLSTGSSSSLPLALFSFILLFVYLVSLFVYFFLLPLVFLFMLTYFLSPS